MKIRLLLVFMLLFIAACTPTPENNVTVTPSSEPLIGSVDITFPMSGAIIYSEVLYISGTASNVPSEGFQIELIAPDDSVIVETTIQPTDNAWVTEIVHEYTGDPTEMTVVAKSLNDNNPLDYDIESIVLSTLEQRPDGQFGSILSPTEGTTVGGDSILISGRGSGLFENTFVLAIESADGERVVEMPFTLENPYFIDDVLWEAELPRNDYIGNASLIMFYQDAQDGNEVILDSIDIVISSVAG